MTLSFFETYALPYYPVFLCFFIWLINISWRRYSESSIWLFWRLLNQRMAEKVLPSNTSSRQASISGTLATIMLIAPITIIVAIVSQAASYQWLLDILLVYIAADFTVVNTKATAANNALIKNKKQLAKGSLQKIVLRQTDSLSPLGIIKACIESYALRYYYQQFTVYFCYFLFGSLFALTYRLLYEACQKQSPKLIAFKKYSSFSLTVIQFIQYIPIRIMNFLLLIPNIILSPRKTLLLLVSRTFWSAGGGSILATVSQALGRSLGGPVIRNSQKVARVRFHSEHEPKVGDLLRLKQLLYSSTLMLFIFSYLIMYIN